MLSEATVMGAWIVGFGIIVFVAAGVLAVVLPIKLVRYRTDIEPWQPPSAGRAFFAQSNYMKSANYDEAGRKRLRALYTATAFQIVGVVIMAAGLIFGGADSLRRLGLPDWTEAAGSPWKGLAGYALAALVVVTCTYALWSSSGSAADPPARDASGVVAKWAVPVAIVEMALLAVILWSMFR